MLFLTRSLTHSPTHPSLSGKEKLLLLVLFPHSLVAGASVMEAARLRLRLVFDDHGILSKSQKKDRLKRSWILLKPHLDTISDVASYLLHHFDLFDSCPNGITLSIDGFVLPPFESIAILKDRELIRVKKKGAKLCDFNKASEGAKTSIEDGIVDKQPLPSGRELIANEEHDKEIRGFESKTDVDEGEGDAGKALLLVENACNGVGATKKRKASNKNENSNAKKQCTRKDDTFQKKHLCHEGIKTSQEGGKLENGSKQDSLFDLTEKCIEPEANREKAIAASGVPDGAKKISRSTRRKRLQRKWKREHCPKDKTNKLNAGSRSNKDVCSNILEHQQADEDSDAEGDLVPVVLRPGHIRFTASGKVSDLPYIEGANVWNGASNGKSVKGGHKSNKSSWDVHSTEKSVWKDQSSGKTGPSIQKNQVAKETSQWNGITNKRKGQKWGTEKQPTAPWKESRAYKALSSGSWDTRKRAVLNFENLIPLIDLPKAGDVVAYRLLELSSSLQCPQLSSFRIGKISSFETKSNMLMLVPDPEYPLNIEKKKDVCDDDASGIPPESSVYNEDGSLEIDFSSIVDVRIVKRGDLSHPVGHGIPVANGTATPSGTSKPVNQTLDGWKNVPSNARNGELHTPTTANGEKDVWEEMSMAMSAKKAQSTQEDNWSKMKVSSSKRSWSQRTLRGRALGPMMAMPRAQNGT